MSVKTHLEEFAKETKMPGFKEIIRTKKTEIRVAWIVVFIFAWAFFTFEFYKVLSSYFKYSKKTITQFDSGGAPFPAITLCNMQGLDFYTAHILHTANLEFLKKWDLKNESFAEFVARHNNTAAFEIAKLDELIWNIKMSLKYKMNKIYSRKTLTSNLDAEILEEGMLSEKEFIIKCSFGNSNCSFKHFLHSYYFKCYTFEPPTKKNKNSGEYLLLSEGIFKGFSVTLFTGTKLMNTSHFRDVLVAGIGDKGSHHSGTAGIRLVIHPPGTEPFPLTEGFDVPPGYQASIGITPKRYKRLGEPYGECNNKNINHETTMMDLKNLTESGHNATYRKVSCERRCIQQRVIEKCKCFDNSLPNPGDLYCAEGTCWHVEETVDYIKRKIHQGSYHNVEEYYRHTKAPTTEFCNSLRFLNACRFTEDKDCSREAIDQLVEKLNCAEKVIDEMMTDVELLDTCKCHPPCDEYRYQTSYSLSRWPSAGYEVGSVYGDIFGGENNFLGRFKNEKKKELYEAYLEQEGINAMKDFAKINVYVEDSNVLETIEEPETTLTELFSEIGGQLGLWIGISVITVSEVLIAIFTLISAGIRKLFGKDKQRDVDVENTLEVLLK